MVTYMLFFGQWGRDTGQGAKKFFLLKISPTGFAMVPGSSVRVLLLAVALKVQMQLRAGKGVESEDSLGRGFPWNTMENEM